MGGEHNAAFVNAFMRTFDGRRDAHGQGRGQCVKEELTERVIRDHLEGKRRIGVYPVAGAEQNRVKFAAIDIDIQDWELATLLGKRFEHYGLKPYIEKTKGKGWHVWTFFEHWIEAWKIRAIMHQCIEDLGDRIPGPLELFPKQDSVPAGCYGNYLNLPLFGADTHQGRTCFHVPSEDGSPVKVTDWSPHDIEMIKEHELDEIVEMNGFKQKKAIQIDATGRPEGSANTTYDTLLPCALRMHRDGGDEGNRNEWTYRLAIHFKRNGYSKADALEIMDRWNSERNRPPLKDRELAQTVSSAFEATHANDSLGCENPLIQPVCVREECPVYRKIHNIEMPTRDDGVEESEEPIDPTIPQLVEFNPALPEFVFVRASMKYTLRSADNKRGPLKALVIIELHGKVIYRSHLNLDSDRSRNQVDTKMEDTHGIVGIGDDLMQCALKASSRIEEHAKEKADKEANQDYVLTEEEQTAAEEWAKSNKHVLHQMVELTSRRGLVREKKNRCLLYLMFTSRMMEKPICGIGKGDSSSGKTFLAQMVLSLIPPEDVCEFTRMTPHAIEYRGEYGFQHKILFIREAPGSDDSQHTLRTFISEGDIVVSTVERNEETGRHEARDLKIYGPVCFYTTTTMLSVDPENETRLFNLFADETAEMTSATFEPIAVMAREGGLRSSDEELTIWRNFQRVLKPGSVIVPYADALIEGFPIMNIRNRRDFSRLIELIKASAFLHQYHRQWDVVFDNDGNPTKAIRASVADYEIVKTVVEDTIMRTNLDLRPTEEDVLKLIHDITSAAMERRKNGMPPKDYIRYDTESTHDGGQGVVVWVASPLLRQKTGLMARHVRKIIASLEGNGLIRRSQRKTPIEVTVEDVSAEHSFVLPTIDPEELYKNHQEDLEHRYDPLDAPDFGDIYGE